MDNDSISKAADALYNMGHVYKEIGDINTAMECWDESDSLYMEVNDIKGNKRIRTALKSIKG